jgi:hypothetical protein
MSFPDGPSLSRNPATGGPSKDVGGRLLFLLFMLASFFLIWVLLILVFEAYRRSFFPADAFLSGGTRLGIILSFLPPIVPAGTLAAQLGYWMTGFVPRARRSVEPQGTPAQRAQVEEQRRRLFRFGRLSLVVVLPLAFVGASTFWSLAPSHVALRPMLWLSTYRYSWADLQSVETGCSLYKNAVSYRFILTFRNGRSVNIAEDSRRFWSAYPQLQTALKGATYRFSRDGLNGPCVEYMSPSHLERLMNPPGEGP